jgi:hypothetical protein
MRFAVAVLFVLSLLALAGCESKSQKLDRRIQKADQMVRDFDAAHPDYQKKCYGGGPLYLDIDAQYPSASLHLSLTSAAEKAAYEAKVKARQAECKPLDDQYLPILREQQDARNARQKAMEDNLINMH